MTGNNIHLRNEELLEPDLMITMYARGAFPMAEENGEINWYLPDVRAVIPVSEFSIPRSLRKFMGTTDFDFKYDTNTIVVVKECADRKETWISSDLIKAYKRLF